MTGVSLTDVLGLLMLDYSCLLATSLYPFPLTTFQPTGLTATVRIPCLPTPRFAMWRLRFLEPSGESSDSCSAALRKEIFDNLSPCLVLRGQPFVVNWGAASLCSLSSVTIVFPSCLIDGLLSRTVTC